LDHRGAELFSGCFGLTIAYCDRVLMAVILHDAWIVNGNIGGALLKAGLGIAAGRARCALLSSLGAAESIMLI
jgi:hypothetical protein